MARKAPTRRGDGSLGYDARRDKITLRHYVDGRQYTELGDSRAEVEAKRDARRRRLAAPANTAAPRTLDELFDRYLAAPQSTAGLSENSVITYGYAIETLRREAGSMPVSATAADIDALLARLAPKYRTMPKIKSMLGKAFKFAAKSGWREHNDNPVAIADRVTSTAPKREAHRLDAEQVAAARRYFAGDTSTRGALFATMLLTGMRPGEALGLKWRWVDFDGGVIRVEEALVRVKGSRRVCVSSSTLKTDHHGPKAHRVVPMRDDLRAILMRERKAQMAEGRAGEYVFTQRDGSPFNPGQLGHQARAVSTILGIPHTTPNAWRHAFASTLADNGMPATMGAKLMGHASTRMWNDVYTHAMRDVATLDLDADYRRPA